MQKKVAIVILNYMNYQETILCVNSVLLQKNVDFQIIIVDNGSRNESCAVLAKTYSQNNRVHILKTGKNYGFARGNNIGIKYARDKFKSEFVLLVNSDTELIDDKYLYILISKYQDNVGVIGSEILLRNGKKQKKYYEYVNFPATFIYYCGMWDQLYGIGFFDRYIENMLKKSKKCEILHGSAFMLTPAYFEKYSGLYNRTFLYTEEILLYIMCKRADLKQVYISDTCILHKEDQSSKYLYQNRNTVKLKYVLSSYKYVVWESLKDFLKLKMMKR